MKAAEVIMMGRNRNRHALDQARRMHAVPMMSEWGATDNLRALEIDAEVADQHLMGWTHWAYKYWNDPTTADGYEMMPDEFWVWSDVERRTIDIALDGRRSRYSVDEVAEAVLTPLRSPVGDEENDVRILKPEGFIWKDGAIGTSERLRVELPEMNFDVSGRHTVYAEFDYAVV